MAKLKKTIKPGSKKPATLPKGKSVAQIAFPAPLIAAVPLPVKEDMTTEPDLITNYIGAKTYEEYVSKKKIPGLPQFLRDAALRHLPVTLDKLKDILDAQTGTRREWVMPDNSPEAVARRAAEKVEKQKLQIFATDDSVGVTVSQMVDGSPKTLAFYANMIEFRAQHDFKTYPFKECRSDKEQTVILVTAKPWAKTINSDGTPAERTTKGETMTERKPRAARNFSQPDAPGKRMKRNSSLGVILMFMMEGKYTFKEIVAKSGVEGGVVDADGKVKHRIEVVLFRNHGVGHTVDEKGIIRAVLPSGFDKDKMFFNEK